MREMAETFPFYLPPEAKRLFVSEGVVRRVAMTAHWTNQVRLLELSGSVASLTLGKELGYEPETIETPPDAEVDELYRPIDAAMGKVPADAQESLKAELELHKDIGPRSGVAYALMVVRRKEPGERPPAARDGG